MNIRYQQQMHDGDRTIEQQLYLTTKNANELANAASALLTHIGSNHGFHHEELKRQMQAMNRRILETDIFMAGVHTKGE
jgi:hypothetical protein